MKADGDDFDVNDLKDKTAALFTLWLRHCSVPSLSPTTCGTRASIIYYGAIIHLIGNLIALKNLC